MVAKNRASFGERLRGYRERKRLTQEGLAEKAGLSTQAIAALESGRRQRPHPGTMQALADALNLDAQDRDALTGALRERGITSSKVPTPPLPTPPTPLIGRAREREEVGRLLQARESRLITLLGPGGVGKSRLAIQVANDLVHTFRDGVAFVSLASVENPTAVIPTVSRVLGVAEIGGQPLLETVISHLRERHMLLVMDNFEQVLDAAPDISVLVTSCPDIAMLLTSRAPLRLRGEREYLVGPLELPELSRIPTTEEATRSEAVRLFVQRATEVSPPFELTQANATAVVAICRRLDGLPLALELAAARVRSLSPTELLARLDRALPLLTGGARDLPERQRTMRRAIEWSYQLLGEPEQRLLNRLSVFRRGWDLEAAEAVGAGESIRAADVVDLLSTLVEQSLVVTEPVAGARTRYRLLVPVREYAEDRLEQSGEANEVQRHHAEHFLAVAEEAEQELRGPQSVAILSVLDANRDNLRAAIEYLLRHRNGEGVARMAWGLWLFWWIRGHFVEGWRWTQDALQYCPDSPRARGWLLAVAGAMAVGQDDLCGAEDVYGKSYPLFDAVGDIDGLGRANIGLGIIALGRADVHRADDYLRQAVGIYRRIGDAWYTGLKLSCLGLVSLSRGDAEAAESELDEGLANMRRAGDRVGICITLYNRSLLAQV